MEGSRTKEWRRWHLLPRCPPSDRTCGKRRDSIIRHTRFHTYSEHNAQQRLPSCIMEVNTTYNHLLVIKTQPILAHLLRRSMITSVCRADVSVYLAFSLNWNLAHPDSAMISGATYVGVPHTVYKGPSTTVARPKSPSFNDLVPSGYSNT